jgi:excisionase family DNA binding protein
MTLREAAEYLHCSYSTLFSMVRNGDFPAFRLGGMWQWRLWRSDMEAWIRRGGFHSAKKGPGKGRPALPQDQGD